MTPYDQWKLATPWDDEPEPCKCGNNDCDCAEEYALGLGDYLYDRMRDDIMEERINAPKR